MDKCCKCGESESLGGNIAGSTYCKHCHPVTLKLIRIIEKKAVNRKRLPKDLVKYFAREYVHAPTLFSEKLVCTRCKQNAFQYGWYDNNYPSKMYSYCTKCNRISSIVD